MNNKQQFLISPTKLFVAIILGVIFISPTYAATIEELLAYADDAAKGQAIAIAIDERDLGFGDLTATMEMTLINAHGDKIRRSMRYKLLEMPARDVGDKSMLIFDNPRDVAGTALLSHAHILEPDDQWLFLPALNRVKRISSKNKSGPFVGSEFAYEDITGNEIGKYSWRFLAMEPCPNSFDLQCFKLHTEPKYEHSGYTKRIVWVDVEELRPVRIDYYDRKNAHMKTQTFNNYKQYLQKYWRAHDWEMRNLLTGKSTTLHFTNYKFRTGLTDEDFTTAALKRAK